MNVAYKNFSDMDSKPLKDCVQNGAFALLLKDTFIVKCQFKIPYFMERCILISKVTRGINCALAYTITSIVCPEKICSPAAVIMKVKSTFLKYGVKYKLHKLVIISMIRLP